MEENKYVIEPRTAEQIERAFTFHNPTSVDQGKRYTSIRNELKSAALLIARSAPPSRELSLALTALETAVFWANAAIARNE